ncbi:hypothetical protein BJ508DRAFT_22090 [Ascobolus immersus RN42]|uniref:Uncharacterized protein n=1 Tax=Ascobolus immersus RN42 TaxID=1160509 RepID=A0A3N4HS50_ASCIM|nr:hypothetical protein BJ508DRAFT_22090 [Ascobolus immersus RN42]
MGGMGGGYLFPTSEVTTTTPYIRRTGKVLLEKVGLCFFCLLCCVCCAQLALVQMQPRPQARGRIVWTRVGPENFRLGILNWRL